MSWIRQGEFLGLSGVSGWYSVPVIHDVQNISANLNKLTAKFNAARNTLANAMAPQGSFALAA